MALTPSPAIDVFLSAIDQKSPTTSGLTGTLSDLINAQVVNYTGARAQGVPNAVRVDKRDAFVTLSDVVRDSADGSIQLGALLANQTLLTEHEKQLVLVANDQTHVYSNTTAAWERHGYQLPTDTLSQDYVYTSNTLATAPDMAHAEGVSCYTWVTEADFNSGGGAPTELAGCYFKIVDGDGVILRSPTRVSATATRIKVVSDGGYFWIFHDHGDGTGNVGVSLVDRHGLDLASTSFACTYASGAYTDVVSTSFGILYAQGNGTGIQFSQLSYDPGTNTITRTSNTDSSISGIAKFGFLTNNSGDGFAYIATIFHIGANNNSIFAYRITSALHKDTTYAVATSQVDEPANVTGYVVPGTTSDIVVTLSILDTTPTTLSNIVRTWYAPFGGTSNHVSDVRSMNIASRAFALRGQYYYVGYYPSATVIVAANEALPNQPTYFLIPMNSPNQNVAGRFEYGSAYCDWQAPGSSYNFAVASCVPTFIDFTDGMRVPLSYRAESFTSQTSQVNGDISLRVLTQATTVGVKSWSFEGNGQAVSFGTDLLLPGPMASTWSGGEFSESNISLAPEQPQLSTNAATPPVPLTEGIYQYVVVYEWTDNNGNRVRSLPSPVGTITVSANQYVTVSGRMLHATNKKDVLISIYRSDMLPDSGGGYVTSTQHYKITVDAPTSADSPLYNDNNQSTWSFDDAHLEITANEILYTDKGALGNYPCPAFSIGAVWKSRLFVAAPDNSIWFSAEQTEGDAPWFHPAFRIVLPTKDRVTALVASTEGYLLVMCASSIWYVPPVTFPDSSGANGTIPEPVELKFNMGCIGPALATRIGIVYASSQGGIWLIPNLSTNQWLSESVDSTLSGPVLQLAIDSRQRIYAVSGSSLSVYDTLSQCWYEWSVPGGSIPLLASYQGQLAFGDGSALVWKQSPGNYVDSKFQGGVSTLEPYNMSVSLNFLHFGGVRSYKRLWATQFIGQTHVSSTVTVHVSYDDVPTVVESKSFVTDPAVAFEYELKPSKQLCSSVAFQITESDSPGQGFSLELLSFYVGLEPKGLNRVSIFKRI